jgi:hypothetical protein
MRLVMVFVLNRIVSLDLERDGHATLRFRRAHLNTPTRDRQFFRDLGSRPKVGSSGIARGVSCRG